VVGFENGPVEKINRHLCSKICCYSKIHQEAFWSEKIEMERGVNV
jgi:hypothetical protein